MEKNKKIKRIAITGGPAAGKSTVIEKLRKLLPEFKIYHEVATFLFENEIIPIPEKITKDWQKLLQRIIFDFQSVIETFAEKDYIFDRGIYDGIAYLRLNHIDTELDNVIWDSKIVYDNVFILRTLANDDIYDEIKKSNPHRFEDKERAIKTHEKIIEVYQEAHRKNLVKNLWIQDEYMEFNDIINVIVSKIKRGG